MNQFFRETTVRLKKFLCLLRTKQKLIAWNGRCWFFHYFYGALSWAFLFFQFSIMMLLTKALLEQFAKVGSQATCRDPLIICKFFDPCSNRTRYATEYHANERVFFGYVEGCENERGTFSLDELEEYRGRLGIGIERDRFFTPCRFSELNK